MNHWGERQNEGGFTLMELVVTAAFMGIVIVSVSGLFIGLRQINNAANNYTIASQVAQQLIEKNRNTPYSAITVGTTDVTSSTLSAYPSLLSPRSATVTVSQVNASGIKQVDVAISYTDRTGLKRVQYSTQIANKGLNR
jgi:type II secretory pathway pseudopilin PulG